MIRIILSILSVGVLAAGCGTVADAAFHGNRSEVASLVESGKDINQQDSVNHWTGLMWAASEGHTEIADYLIQHGADPNLKDDDGLTAMQIAASRDRLEIAKLLVAHKADVNSQDKEGFTPLLRASTPAIRKVLIESGADVNARNKAGLTPLWDAAVVGDGQSVELLVQKGARVNEKSGDRTPLLAVCAFEEFGSAMVKIATGVRWDALSDAQKTEAFDRIAKPIMDPRLETARHLLKAGANISATDDLGQSALHWAVASLTTEWLKIGGLRALVKIPAYEPGLSGFSRTFLALLLDAGVPVNTLDSKGRTPLALFRSLRKSEAPNSPTGAFLAKYNDDIDRFLVERGAK
jgi:uncharacterized protein